MWSKSTSNKIPGYCWPPYWQEAQLSLTTPPDASQNVELFQYVGWMHVLRLDVSSVSDCGTTEIHIHVYLYIFVTVMCLQMPTFVQISQKHRSKVTCITFQMFPIWRPSPSWIYSDDLLLTSWTSPKWSKVHFKSDFDPLIILYSFTGKAGS